MFGKAKQKKENGDFTAQKPKYRRISPFFNFVWNTVFTVAALSCILPLILVIMVSVTDERSLIQNGYSFFPKEFGFEGYAYIFKRGGAILNSYKVSIITTLLGTLCSTTVIALYAFPISRSGFRFKKFFTWYVFLTMLYSGGLVPWYIVYTQLLKIGDTLPVLIIPALVNAWYVLIMRTFYKSSIPDELLESARIDGASEFRIFFSIVAPLSKAGLATVALFAMLNYWNDWYLPMIFIRRQELYNIQYTLKSILENIQFLARMSSAVTGGGAGSVRDIPSETVRMTIAVAAVGPIVLAYPFFQRFFVQGLTIGAVKG